MRIRFIRAIAASFVLAGAATAQTYVDPVGGVDGPGAGTLTAPFKTLTACAASLAGAGGSQHIVIMPGWCTVFSGEVFPIVLPDAITVEAMIPGTVNIETTIISALFPDAFQLGPNATFGKFEGVKIKGHAHGITVEPGAGVHLQLSVLDCRLSGGWGLLVGSNGGDAAIVIARSELFGVNSAVRLRADLGGTVDVSIVDSTFDKGMGGLELACYAGGTLRTSISNTAFTHQGSFGIRSTVDPTATAIYDLDHVVFAHVGIPTGKPTIRDMTTFGGLATYSIQNSIFHECVDPIPGYGPTYTIGHTIFTANALPGTGNLTGDPNFVAPEFDDFHVAPGSMAIDAGITTAVLADRDGDPVPGHPTHATPGIADIGVDEFYDASFWFRPERISLESETDLVAVGQPGSLAILFVSANPGNPVFGPAFHLTLPVISTVVGVVPASGVLTATLPPVLDQNFLGVEAWTQVAYAFPPFGLWSYAARRVTFVP